MAYLRVDLNGELTDGYLVTFKAPCDCTAFEALRVYYPKDGEKISKTFYMKDTHGNNLAGLGNLFLEGAYVSAILNTVDGVAYLQNSATNGYLEERIDNMEQSFGMAASEIGDAIVALGVEVPEGATLHEMAGIITDNLLFVPKEQTLTSSHKYSSTTDIGSSRWTVPFTSITANDVISVANGAFTCRTAIKKLVIGATVHMGCGSLGSAHVCIASGGQLVADAGSSPGTGEKTVTHNWENVPEGTVFAIQTYSVQPNAPTVYLSGNVTLKVTL